MEELTEEEIKERIQELDKWTYAGNMIKRQYNFKDFESGMEFVNELAELAEEHEHHPNIFISYNQVRLTLYTHSIGGITDKDFELAREIEDL